jgi:hypothetical protein
MDIRGYINIYAPGQTESGQRAAMPEGAELYIEDRRGNVIDKLIASVRRRSVVAVKDIDCVAPINFNAQKRRRIFRERVEAIIARGGSILELSTGRSSKRQLAGLMTTAHERIARSGRGRKSAVNGKVSNGAPRIWPRSGPIYEGMKLIFLSRHCSNDNQRMTAIKKEYGKVPSRVWLRQQFGGTT